MSQALQIELLRARPFAGIPSYARRIAQIEALLSGNIAVSKAVFTETNARQDQEIDRLERGNIGIGWKNYYIGGPLASDENNGLTADTPWASLFHLLNNIDLSEPNHIWLEGDIDLDRVISLPNVNTNLRFRSKAGERYKINVIETGRLACSGIASIQFILTDIFYDKENNVQALDLVNSGALQFATCNIDMSDRARDFTTGRIFNITPLTNFYASGLILGAGVQDRLFIEAGVSRAFASDRLVFQGA